MIKAEIVADSINMCGNRLTTFVLEYPRFCHSELLTHRMFSKNSASSRAIPIEKMIQQVIDNPATPVWWGKNQSGMQAKEELNLTDREKAQIKWLEARDIAIGYVRQLMEIGLHKQIANRILEPWFNIRIILSGTEFENFFALRAHPDAQPEIQALAYKMLEEYNKSTPKKLNNEEWHIPFGDKMDIDRLREILPPPAMNYDNCQSYNSNLINVKIKISVARCARVSYLNYEGKDDYEADVKLCDRLFGNIPRHLSPAEHVAQALDSSEFVGNFRGFKQYRYFFLDQNLKDLRVLKK